MPYDVPRLALPWPPAMNPHVDTVERELVRWTVRAGLVVSDRARHRLESMNFGRCAALTFSRADATELTLCGSWLVWIFLLDDQHGQPGGDSPEAWETIARHLGAVLQGEHDVEVFETNPMIRATADLCRRTFTHPQVSPELAKRIAGHIELLLDGFRREAAYRLDNLPSADKYVDNRRRNAGMYLFADLLELTEKTEVPAVLYDSPVFRDLLDATTDIGAWQNDIISLDAEQSRGELSNFVIVLQLTEGMSRDEAIEAVRERISARIGDFTAGERALPQVMGALNIPIEDRARLVDLVAQLRQWVNGCLLWSSETRRYADPSLYQPEMDLVLPTGS
jgi:terpene synthase-like protein